MKSLKEIGLWICYIAIPIWIANVILIAAGAIDMRWGYPETSVMILMPLFIALGISRARANRHKGEG